MNTTLTMFTSLKMEFKIKNLTLIIQNQFYCYLMFLSTITAGAYIVLFEHTARLSKSSFKK